MPLLAIDASSGRVSALLWQAAAAGPEGRIMAAAGHEGPTGDAARLPRMVADLLAMGGIGVADLGAVAVAVGPGSFTGLRASLAFAEGMAAALAFPVIGVTAAEALAVAAAEAGATGPSWCALDARQGRVYLHRGGAPADWEMATLAALPLPDRPVVLTGDAAPAVGRALAVAGVAASVTEARLTDARLVAVAGMARLQGLLPPLAARPLYIEPPRAQPPRGGLRPPPAAPVATAALAAVPPAAARNAPS